MEIDTILSCARCGHKHTKLEVKQLTNPVLDDDDPDIVIATHWAMCPKLNEPILVYVSENGKMYRDNQ